MSNIFLRCGLILRGKKRCTQLDWLTGETCRARGHLVKQQVAPAVAPDGPDLFMFCIAIGQLQNGRDDVIAAAPLVVAEDSFEELGELPQ